MSLRKVSLTEERILAFAISWSTSRKALEQCLANPEQAQFADGIRKDLQRAEESLHTYAQKQLANYDADIRAGISQWVRDYGDPTNDKYSLRYHRCTGDYRTSGTIIEHINEKPKRYTLSYGGIEETSHRSMAAAKRHYNKRRKEGPVKS